MTEPFKPDPNSRVRMRTDGPPVPIEFDEDPPSYRPESFVALSRRHLPWMLIVTAMAVLFGAMIGQAVAATA